MNQQHDQNLSQSEEDEALKVVRWGRWLLAIIMLVLILLMSFGWLLRKGFAERAMENWCAGRDLTCSATFDKLDANGATLSDIVVRSKDAVPFEAESVMAKLEWTGPLTPKLVDLSVTDPVLRGTFKDGRLTLYGLEKLATGGQGGGAAPNLSISDGRVIITTDAGDITATANVEGRLPEDGTLVLQLDPADLDGPNGQVNWQAGEVNLRAAKGELHGTINMDLQTALLNDIEISGARLDAELRSDAAFRELSVAHLHADLEAAAWPAGEAQSLTVDAVGQLNRLPEMTVDDVVSSLTNMAFDVQGEAIRAGQYATGAFTGGGSLERDVVGLSGPVELTAAGLETPQGRLAEAAFQGEVLSTGSGGWSVGGQLTGAGIAASETLSEQLETKLKLPGLLSPHGKSLQNAVHRALADFDTAAGIRLRRANGAISFAVEGPVDLSAKSGLRLKLVPPAGQPPLSFENGTIRLQGALDVSGGGLPKASAQLTHLQFGKEGLDIGADAVSVAPWTAGGRTLSARLERLQLRDENDGMLLNVKGRLGLAGAFPGIALSSTTVSGSLTGTESAKGWIVRSATKCLDVNTDGLKAGGLRLGSISLPVCPQQRRLYSPEGGSLSLGYLSVPFDIGANSSGRLSLEESLLDWSAKKGVALTLRGKATELPLEIGERSLNVNAADLQLGLITGNGPLRLSLRADAPTFEGSLVPANIVGDRVRFDGSVPDGGISGTLVADRLVFTDKNDDPLFQPLTSDINASLSNGRLEFIAPVRLMRGGISVADAKVDLDVVKLDGAATVNTRPLAFQPGGLQPHMLSDRLRGLFTDAVGNMEGQASLLVDHGKLFGTGRVAVKDFSFQTQRLGRVQNVDGEVVFTDLLGLTTAPKQIVTVGQLNPGIPLEDGELRFQLLGGKQVHVASAAFPFAGGQLSIQEMDWHLGSDQQEFSVSAQFLRLEQIIEVFKLPDIKATGTVSGGLPVRIDGNRILVENARLKADETGGFLSYTGDVGDKADAAGEYGKMAFEALKKLDYSVLELGVDGNLLGDITVDLLMVGKSTEVLNGQPFEYDISINSKLAQLLQSRLYYSSQDWLSDVKTGTLPGGGTVENENE